MFNENLRNVMEHRKFLVASPDESVAHACRLMKTRKAGAVLVTKDGSLTGIFTERDAVFRVIARGLDPEKTSLRQVMTLEPMTLGPDKTYGHALLLMHDKGFRHMPVVENGKPIGIVSSRNAMDPDLQEFAWEERRRDYYLHPTPERTRNCGLMDSPSSQQNAGRPA